MSSSHIIAGGGIGGLTAALALSRRGLDSLVLERAQEFREIGAGLQLGPNVWPMFQRLGIAEEIRARTVFPDELVTMDGVSGQRITHIPLKEKFLERFRYPYGLIHRADLHSILFEQCKASPQITMKTSQKVSRFIDRADGVRVEAQDGSRYVGAALIGADGLW